MASNPSDVSNARGQSESTDEDQKTPSICPACQHSMESHDPLGVRFCAVTADRGLDRKCICAADREEMPALFALLRCILHPNRRRTDL